MLCIFSSRSPRLRRQSKGASPLDPPGFNFLQGSHTAKFHGPNCRQTVRMRRIRRILRGARVGRPRAPVVPSLSDTIPHRFSTEPLFFTTGSMNADLIRVFLRGPGIFMSWRDDNFLKTNTILLTRTLACPVIISLLKYNLL
jgi:hypothetical protein